MTYRHMITRTNFLTLKGSSTKKQRGNVKINFLAKKKFFRTSFFSIYLRMLLDIEKKKKIFWPLIISLLFNIY
ncbi:hypothetical protein GLOIN_2v1561372 [Rhizophagus irregularis DAOM 181602=DAOM 197198]|uniref:Uncharacterized protein n=1 Tax=Rhizophagus irregularis (strain DAOM 181602 / DAOM 197198 / MUCL 43194) TaxID=747089 RepID=A0A2P4QE17_RHIID|nr:hypothetical protein GLOIN_2v1561372 [Rhizophagus irregularis DAOM 181602=DAOM 197198]POG75874.1 hypothetical protein GLOIN_2v1561372 [Rhizophagus irregularis DAOM 181602=DAOM 197198]GET53612.1 hypothetical protein GLOIN_2v1561372 [Rhizophagus irregularis DAOM 181602=DAOM 197198]|eukprot:XP_025182740.1 hypothetical protein GLOIN_2v1561372 [Rhizophagus irregularis DAOM 181602=DAOM 197198]